MNRVFISGKQPIWLAALLAAMLVAAAQAGRPALAETVTVNWRCAQTEADAPAGVGAVSSRDIQVKFPPLFTSPYNGVSLEIIKAWESRLPELLGRQGRAAPHRTDRTEARARHLSGSHRPG